MNKSFKTVLWALVAFLSENAKNAESTLALRALQVAQGEVVAQNPKMGEVAYEKIKDFQEALKALKEFDFSGLIAHFKAKNQENYLQEFVRKSHLKNATNHILTATIWVCKAALLQIAQEKENEAVQEPPVMTDKV